MAIFTRKYAVVFIVLLFFIVSPSCSPHSTGDWSTYRHDNARSGITGENLPVPLALRWTFEPTHPPEQAWLKPGEEMERMHYDNAYHITAARGMAYFGSSVDNKVYALNAHTGRIKWTFFTQGPVRYAPTVWENRLYFGSDDGYVYCLRAKTGKFIWKYRASAGEKRLLGNGRMISLWPVRTSVIVDDGIVYFGAGVFPYEGVYICAVNAGDGSVIWKNDTIGDHAHELAYGGVSPQSYLIASENILYVPSGRAMPAAFGRKSGEFLYYLLPGAKVGGTWALLDKNKLIAGVDLSGTPAKRVYEEQTGARENTVDNMHAWFPGIDLIVTSDVSYTLTEKGIYALDREKYLVVRNSKMNLIMKERQKLKDKRSEIIRKIQEAAGEARIGMYDLAVEEIEKKLMDLGEEEKSLKSSIYRWEYLSDNLVCLILAGSKIFAGGEGTVLAVDTQTGRELWKSEIQGKALGLAAANGKLFVSTDKGRIYCFGKGRAAAGKKVSPAVSSSPYRKDKLTGVYESAAEKIIKDTGINKGYCLVLGCGEGRLAFELAKRSELKVIGIENNLKKVMAAKHKLDAAEIYGSRVVVEQWDLSTLPDYFADLIVSEEMMISGEINSPPEEVYRVLKPFGGMAYFGQPAELSGSKKPLDLEALLEWLRKSSAPEPEVTEEDGIWAKVTRGKLEGSGSWTELYGNPQNTACSGDELVRGPLGVLWFGEPGPERMVERHAKAASPVSSNGRIFIQGEEVIMAYDVFNGTLLWERKIEGAVRARADVDGGNLVVTDNVLYVAAHNKCYCLDPVTGEIIKVFEIPPPSDGSSRRWGYISYLNNILYGSRAESLNNAYFALWNLLIEKGRWRNKDDIPVEYIEEYQSLVSKYPVPDDRLRADFKRSGALWRFMANFPDWENYNSSKEALTGNMMASDLVFAMNPETGKLNWKYQGKKIAHITVSLGEGKIFFAESAISAEQKRNAFQEKKKFTRKGIYEESSEKEDYRDADVRVVVCLDAVSGKELWEKPVDFTGCGGDSLGSAYQDGVLLFFANVGDHDAWRFSDGLLRWKRLTALSAKNGDILWSRPINCRVRPVIVGNRVFIEPRVCDLYTGEIKMRSHPITGREVPWEYLRPGHTCAISSASAHSLFYRSFCTAFYDFTEDRGLNLFGAIRPGCWINMIPANGLLLFPEASSGCTCSFPLRCSLVLKHKEERIQPWSVFITHGSMTPAKHFAINLGAPGDMKHNNGSVWFAYPNPETESLSNHFPNYGVKFDLHDEILTDMGYFCRDFRNTAFEGTDKPWLFTSGCIGLKHCKVQLIDDMWGEKPGVYTICLGFGASSSDSLGQRVFDIILQGEPVLQDFDILKEAGSANKVVIKEFKNINVENFLTIELSSKEKNPNMANAPIINFIEAIREDRAVDLEKLKPLTLGRAAVLLDEAEGEFRRGHYNKALAKFHLILDAAPSERFKLGALKGMAAIGSPDSLSRITKYCRDVAPILWNYKEPGTELKNSAIKVFIAVANNIAKRDKQKAIRMLNYALTITDVDMRKQVVSSLSRYE